MSKTNKILAFIAVISIFLGGVIFVISTASSNFDFTKLNINDSIILNKHKLVSHDNPYIFEKNIKNSEIINLTIDWMPLNESSEYDEKFI